MMQKQRRTGTIQRSASSSLSGAAQVVFICGLAVGCSGSGGVGNVNDDSGTSQDASSVADSSVDSSTPTVDCSDIPDLPPQHNRLTGFTGSEDFTFDDQGNLVSMDGSGNLTRQPKTGARQVWVPNVANDSSGISFLPNGDLVVANGQDALILVTPEGGTSVILSGLAYPNGVTVDLEGYVYVSEQNSGQVRRVDPTTSEFTVIAQGLMNPNGLSFGPSYERLYIGSFGAGTVHYIEVDSAGDWTSPVLLARTPNAPDIDTACEGLSVGDPCTTPQGEAGECQDWGGGVLACVGSGGDPYAVACEGKAAGDPCTVVDMGIPFDGQCLDDVGALYCVPDWVLPQELIDACASLSEGDPCQAQVAGNTIRGSCSYEWSSELACLPSGGMGGAGGLDGVAVDACGNVYVTEFTLGYIYRISPDGSQVEMVLETGVSWIPNMHFGTGLGGWDPEVLYVIDRDQGGILELELGVPGKRKPFPR